MAHHAYFLIGKTEEMVPKVRSFAAHTLSLSGDTNVDIIVRTYGLFSVEDARALRDMAELGSSGGGNKALIVTVERMFHESQNALLKLFEEPPKNTFLFLIIPSEGILLPTLRSRLQELPEATGSVRKEKKEHVFLSASSTEREKMIARLLDRAKSDKDEEKQAARAEALAIIEGLSKKTYELWTSLEATSPKKLSYQVLLSDLVRLTPILHERSAPLKQIFEHIVLVLRKDI